MCWYCGSAINDPEPLGRSLKCLDCGKDLRVCKNCRHIRPSGCAESSAEKPAEQDRANFCDWFSLNPVLKNAATGEKKSKGAGASDAAAKAKSAFDELFK